MRFNFSLAIIFILLNGCQSNHVVQTEAQVQSSTKKLSYTITPYLMDSSIVESISFKQYSIYEDEEEYLFLMNDKKNSLESYHLATKKMIWSMSYSKFYDWKKYEVANSFYVHNWDSIFIAQEFLLTAMDTSQIWKTIGINKSDKGKLPKYYLKNLDNTPFSYDSKVNKVIAPVYCATCYPYKKEYYQTSLDAYIDLETEKVALLPIKYPVKYQNEFYGIATNPSRTVVEDYSIYSFPVDPNIYCYDRMKDTLLVYGGRSAFQKAAANPLDKKYKNDIEKQFQHLVLSPNYVKILYDKYRALYYRFFLQDIPLKNEEGLYNTWQDKKLVLMVFDNEMKLIEEVDLGINKYYFHKSFVSQKGLFVHRVDISNDHQLAFDIFDFQVLK